MNHSYENKIKIKIPFFFQSNLKKKNDFDNLIRIKIEKNNFNNRPSQQSDNPTRLYLYNIQSIII